jgi:hypothetical protein
MGIEPSLFPQSRQQGMAAGKAGLSHFDCGGRLLVFGS